MNYLNHNLRVNLQEWLNRIARSSYTQFGNQLKFLFNKLQNNNLLSGIIGEACITYPYSDEKLNELFKEINNQNYINDFESEKDQAAFNYQLLSFFFKEYNDYNLTKYNFFLARDFETTKDRVIEIYISPILNYLHDTLDESSSVVYLLEKYKKRAEWFTKDILFKNYKEAKKSYEQIFEDDLRMFLFDQGIDYPFSTPASASGRADIVSNIESDDPMVLEIKIYDEEKGYKKNRILDGFKQIVRYANDYHKSIGYLVIFNVSNKEIIFDLTSSETTFPPYLNFNYKTFYFITINIYPFVSASISGKTEKILITEKDLIA